ncbi:Zn(2)-C6 fungal-type domain-containing protein [Trichoderma simmonsii]|uniref:Zn(2)-C6 fungal-type domain-containing protein n=1 Tax=Trichoderma simmonsii TaxID=1491479 RepID=A0A8G0PHF3_9HYPO|nr:Zn(2)-C6 fungal-type domain-containing protein [Trichoderma simmonsii]
MAGSSPPANKRRAHTKSRTGCAECRRRRVKCGEEKPSCRHCFRRSIPCLYPSQDPLPIHPAKASSSPMSVVTAATSNTASATAAQLPQSPLPAATSSRCHSPLGRVEKSDGAIPTYTIKDMALLHHWTWSTSKSVADFPDVSRYWQTVFPQIAFEHTFVMHAILSLAALHQAYLYPERRKQLTMEAMRYHNQAIHGFQRGIEHMNDGNSDALFAWSSLNIIYVFATYGQLYDDVELDMTPAARKSRVLGVEWLPMVRGVEAILHPVYQHVRFGPLSSLLSTGNWDHLDPDSERVADDERFRNLGDIWADSGDHEIYDKTLFLLRKSLAYMKQFETMNAETAGTLTYNRRLSGPIVWVLTTPGEYFQRLHQRQPHAMLLFAYFGVVIHSLNGYWFFEGWGRNIVEVVEELLGEYWKPWTEWPKQAVGLS